MLNFQAKAERRHYGSEIFEESRGFARLAMRSSRGSQGFGPYGTRTLLGSSMLPGHNIDPLTADATIRRQWWPKLDSPGMGSTHE